MKLCQIFAYNFGIWGTLLNSLTYFLSVRNGSIALGCERMWSGITNYFSMLQILGKLTMTKSCPALRRAGTKWLSRKLVPPVTKNFIFRYSLPGNRSCEVESLKGCATEHLMHASYVPNLKISSKILLFTLNLISDKSL